ncbi:MAG: STAS domain-containing protein [Methylophilaceae bacterium]
MAQILQVENRWQITGDILVDNANTLLVASQQLAISGEALIDFANVTEIDTSAISIMLAWRRRAIAENKQLKFINLPANLSSLTQLYGVADFIN